MDLYPSTCHYAGGSYRVFSEVGSSNCGARVLKALHVPHGLTHLQSDYPFKAHRILKIVVNFQDSDILEFLNLRLDVLKSKADTHSNLLAIERAFEQGNDYVIAMEDVDGCLRDLIKKGGPFPNGMPEHILGMAMTQVIQGIAFLHSKDKPLEILDTWSLLYTTRNFPCIKLSIWGTVFASGIFVEDDKEDPRNQRTSTKVTCPELRGSHPEVYTIEGDIWHLGVTIIELALGELKCDSEAIIDDIVDALIDVFRVARQTDTSQIYFLLHNMQITGKFMTKTLSKKLLGRYFSPELVDLVVQCTHNDPGERITAENLLEHSFFKKFVSDDLKLQHAL